MWMALQKHRAKIILMSKTRKKGVGKKGEKIIEETGGENSPVPMTPCHPPSRSIRAQHTGTAVWATADVLGARSPKL